MRFHPIAPTRPLSTLLLLGLLGVPQLAAQSEEATPAADRTFAGETTVTVVEVPVRVLKDGEPVTGLGPGDFRIFDQGEERPVLSVERVDLREVTGAGAAQGPSPAARRHFLLLYDLAFTDGPYLRRAVDAGRDLIEEGLHPTDLVAVAFFSLRGGLSEVVGFTPDHGQALRALDELAAFLGSGEARVAAAEGDADGEDDGVRASDPLRFRVGDWSARLLDVGVAGEAERSIADEAMDYYAGAGSGRRGELGALPDMAVLGERDMRQIRAAEATALVGTLGDLAEAMRWVDGAKYLVLFSRGFESSTYANADPASEATGLLDDLHRAVEQFRQSGWSIHSIETTGALNTANRRERREALFFLAEETGGILIENQLDLSKAMERVLEETSVTYVLTFQSPPLPADGSFRDLRVELAPGSAAPDGARVLHRAGYFTPEPFVEMDPAERRAATAELVLAGRTVEEIACRLLVSPVAVPAADRMRVAVVLAVDAKSFLASRKWQATRVEALAYAFDEAGRVAGTWGRELVLAPDTVMKATQAGSLVFHGELELAPGTYEVRSVIRNVDDGRVTLRNRTLRIPDGSEEAPMLLEPIFADLAEEGEDGATERRILIRDVTYGTEYPFVFEDRRFLPALAPTVLPGVETTVIGRGIWEESPRGLRAVVFDAAGFPVPGGAAVRFLGAAEDDGRAVHQLAFGFRPTDLPPGDYELRFFVEGPGGATVSSPPAPFRVGQAASAVD